MSHAAAGAAAVAAAIAQAVKASGAIVRVEPKDFLAVLNRTQKSLVVTATGRFLRTSYHYLTGYKGLVFYTKSPTPLQLPADVELVQAKRIWVPS